MKTSFKIWSAAFCAALAACAAPAQTPAAASDITAEDLCADLDFWIDWTLDTHPDLSWSVDPATFQREAETVCARLDGRYDPRRAWLAVSVLNPVLNDAHAGVRYPEAAFEAWREQGGAAFPAPVEVREDGVFVAGAIADTSRLQPGDKILEINGVPSRDVLAALLPRMRGESDALRRRVLTLRFSGALWALTGGADHYTVSIGREGAEMGEVRLHADRDGSGAAAPAFALDWRDAIAVMRVDTFDRDREAEFAAFLEAAFAEIAARGAEALVIDLRANGGGARELSDLLMAYLTDRRYTPISAVTARITPENQALVPGSELGQVISAPFAQWVEPPAGLPNRFTGETVVLIGPHTYSQAVVFAATAQDFQIARLAGRPTEGAANQSGQVQSVSLPHSGLTALSPIYVFTRASGDPGREPLRPDIPLPGKDGAQLDALLRLIEV